MQPTNQHRCAQELIQSYVAFRFQFGHGTDAEHTRVNAASATSADPTSGGVVTGSHPTMAAGAGGSDAGVYVVEAGYVWIENS